jgi:hypothetical protein
MAKLIRITMHWREGCAKESAGGMHLGQAARKPQRVLTGKVSTATLTEISKLSEKLRGTAAPATATVTGTKVTR